MAATCEVLQGEIIGFKPYLSKFVDIYEHKKVSMYFPHIYMPVHQSLGLYLVILYKVVSHELDPSSSVTGV